MLYIVQVYVCKGMGSVLYIAQVYVCKGMGSVLCQTNCSGVCLRVCVYKGMGSVP